MDPFSVTAGVAGLLSLILQLTERLTEYSSSVRHAATESHDLVVQLTALVTVLQRLQQWLGEQSRRGTTFDATSLLYTTTSNCHTKLSSLDKTVQQFMDRTRSVSKLWKRGVMWPLQKKEQQHLISTIHQWIQIFNYSLTIDGCSILSASEESLTHIRVSQAASAEEIIRLAEGLKTISDSIDQSNRVTQSSLDSLHEARVATERLGVLQWLSPIDPSTNLNAALRVRQHNTGLWFLESQAFADWIKTPLTLWLHGIPGCGKTVLCSTIIEAIEELCSQSDSQQVAYFFFDFQTSDKRDVSFMMCSLIRQLSAVQPEIPEAVRAVYLKSHATGHSPTLEELIAVFTSVVSASPRDTFIILDALDEVPVGLSRRETLELMKRLTGVAPGRLRLLVTSRDQSDIRMVLEEIVDEVILLQNGGVGTDIRAFVRARLESARFMQLPLDTKNEIEIRVGGSAHGMFRWASCQIDMLEQCRKVGEIKRALTRLPDTLDETYARMLASVPANEIEDLLSIFQWLVCSKRPLTLQEVAEAAVRRPSISPLDPEERLFDALECLRLCRGLVTISKQYVSDHGKTCEVVRFVHFSVQEYFLSGRATAFGISTTSSHLYVAKCCISNLLTWVEPNENQRSLPESQLLQYSGRYWPEHVHMAGDGDTELLNLVFKLFSPDHSKHFNKWLQINDPFSDHLTGMGTNYKNNCPSPLLYATKLGFRDCALRLLKAGADVNACHSVHGTPLSKACELGNQNLAKLLLQYGASIDKLGAATNVPYGTPLEVAVAKGKSCIVHLLLSKGANPNAQGRYGNVLHTALSSTCSPGITTDIALCLIRAGAIKFSIFSTEPSSMTCMASLRGLESVVEELLRNVTLLRFEGPAQRADITGPRGLKRIHSQLSQHLDWRWELKLSDSTVLTWQKGITIFRFLRNPTSFSNSLRPRNRLRERMMRQPLSPAAAHVFTDTNIETGRGRQSSKNRHESVFLVILNSGINPKYWGQYPSHILTPLAIYTYRYRRVQIVQWQTSHTWNGNISSPPASKLDDLDRANLLIRASQDLEAQTISSDSALHLALAKGYVPSFQKSLDPGPNFREMDEQSGSPLQRASSADNEAMVKLLLSSGLSANIAVGNSFGTALQEASYHNHELMVELLLNAGADVNQPGFGPRQTALQEAVKQGNLQIMEILLHSGATAGTALPEASKRGSIDIVRRLLAADADPNAHLPGGKTALQEACAHGHFDLASLLIGMGANVNTPGVRDVGGTALQEASSEGYLRIVQLLLTSGADVNAAGISGWCGTALQEAAHASQVQLTKLLIQSGADVNAPAGYWGSAVEAAAAAGCNDVIEILIESGAAVGDALRVATREENIETVRLLLQRCWADITHQDGMTVLHEAVENSDIAMAEILLDYGANINTAATANCPTPLQLAYDIGDNRMIEFLIDRGADVNVASCHHCVTPQQLTLSRGYTGVLEVLLKIGVYIWSMRITHEKEIDEAV